MKRLLLLVLLLNFQFLCAQSFTGVNPKYDEYMQPGTPVFEWNTTGASSYTLEVASDPSFATIVFTEVTTNTSTPAPSPLSSGIYYWRVFDGGNYTPSYRFQIFEPAQDPNLRAWLDPNTGVTQNGSGEISSWSDPINGLSFDQNNTAEQPQFEANGFGGHPEIQFSGSQVLEGGDVLDLNSNSHSFFVVARSSGDGQAIFSKAIFAGQQSRYALWYSGGESQFLYHDNVNRTVAYDTISTSNEFFQAHIDRSLDSLSFSVSDWLPSPNIILKNNHNMDSPFRFLIGAYNNSNDDGEILHLDGSISEIIMTSTVDSQKVEDMRNYIKYKYMPKLDLGRNIAPYSYCDTTIYAGSEYKDYLWSDGSTADSLIVSESGTYWVEVTDIFGFTSSDTIEVIFPEPDTPSNQQFCPSDSITWYTNLGPDYDYLWSDGSTADSLSIDAPGDYHVQITDTNGCVFQSDTLTFEPDPFESIVTLGPDQNLCTGNVLTLADGDSLAVDYLWSTGSTDSSITLNTTDTYYVDVVNANGCEASDTIDVTIIGDAPLIDMGIPNSICRNAPFSFQDLSSTTDGSTIINWSWDFGDGSSSTSENGSHTYTSPGGNYPVSLTIETSAGCFKDTMDTLVVLDTPELSFTSNNACQGNNIQFNGGQLTPTTIATWEWDFDDPSSGANNTASGPNVSHIFNNSDTFEIRLVGTDINGCIDTVTQSKTILPSPQVDFTFEEICEGNSVIFQNNTTIESPGSVAGYNWSFGDGTNSGQENPQKPYNTYGDYSINLIVTSDNGCSGQRTKNLKVHAIPFVDQNVVENCAGLPTAFNDASYVPNGSIAQATWSINNGDELQGLNVTNSFETPGNYTVTQTISSAFGCSNSATFPLDISDFLSAGFDIDPSVLIADYPIQLIDKSQGADSLNWFINQTAYSDNSDTTFISDTASIGDSVTILQYVKNSFGCIDSIQRTYNIVEQRTDLAVEQLFLEELNGYLTVGVQLHNRGTTPVHIAELELKTANGSLKETWEGNLREDESIIYVFDASPSSTVSAEDVDKNRICVEAQIQSPQLFNDEDLSNNEQCLSREETFILLQPQPNPVDQLFSVKLIANDALTGSVHIINTEGRIVQTLANEKLFKQGLNKLNVDASSFSSGTYTIIFVNDEHTKATRFIKL